MTERDRCGNQPFSRKLSIELPRVLPPLDYAHQPIGNRLVASTFNLRTRESRAEAKQPGVLRGKSAAHVQQPHKRNNGGFFIEADRIHGRSHRFGDPVDSGGQELLAGWKVGVNRLPCNSCLLSDCFDTGVRPFVEQCDRRIENGRSTAFGISTATTRSLECTQFIHLVKFKAIATLYRL